MKPEILSDEELVAIEGKYPDNVAEMTGEDLFQMALRLVAQAQRDADVEWYEKKYLIPDYEWNLQQARQDIFEEIEKASSPMNTNMHGISLSKAQWQTLKNKFLSMSPKE